jgi:phage gpG-like protein
MQDPFKIPLERLAATIELLKPQLIDGIGVEALKFIDDNFRVQGFQGQSFQPWAQLKTPPRPSRAILVNTAALRRSFRKEDSSDHTTTFTDIPYARTHNEGLQGPQYVRSRMGTFGKTFTRHQNIPQRQFIGASPVLTHNCEAFIIRKLTTELNKL